MDEEIKKNDQVAENEGENTPKNPEENEEEKQAGKLEEKPEEKQEVKPEKNSQVDSEQPEKKSKAKPDQKPQEGKFKKRSAFSNLGLGKERDYFMENLSMLLASGMNITAALEAIKSGLRSKIMKQIVDDLKVQIDDGSPIWRALDNTGLVSNHAIALIKIGEESGRLPANLKVISIQTQKERLFRQKLFSALMYPVAVLCLTFVIGIGIAWFILPNLAKVFDSMRMELPLITKILINFGKFLGKHGITVIPIFIVF